MNYTLIIVRGENGAVGRHECTTMQDVQNWIFQAAMERPSVLSITIINNSVIDGR